MSLYIKCLKTIYSAIACISLFTVSNASAVNLPCIQRLIDWNKAFGTNYVKFRLVSLQSPSNLSVFVPEGKLVNQTCLRYISAPIYFLPYTCLKSSAPAGALFSNRIFAHPSSTPSTLGSFGNYITQRFDASRPLQLTVDDISVYSGMVNMHIVDRYTFTPQCVGNMLVGNDEYGNHWTMSFSISRDSVVN